MKSFYVLLEKEDLSELKKTFNENGFEFESNHEHWIEWFFACNKVPPHKEYFLILVQDKIASGVKVQYEGKPENFKELHDRFVYYYTNKKEKIEILIEDKEVIII